MPHLSVKSFESFQDRSSDSRSLLWSCNNERYHGLLKSESETTLQRQSSVEQSVVVGKSWKLLASSLVLRMKSNVSSIDDVWNLLTWGTDLLLPWRRFLAISAMSIMWVSTSFTELTSITGEESLLQDDVVELEDTALMFPELFRRNLLSAILNFSSMASYSPPRAIVNVEHQSRDMDYCMHRVWPRFIIKTIELIRGIWLVFGVMAVLFDANCSCRKENANTVTSAAKTEHTAL